MGTRPIYESVLIARRLTREQKLNKYVLEAGVKLTSKMKSAENFTISKIFGALFWCIPEPVAFRSIADAFRRRSAEPPRHYVPAGSRANTMLVTNALPQDVAFLAFIPMQLSGRSRRIPLQSTKFAN